MDNDGMVAVVRGTKDSGIRVTLLDGNNQYTLVPNSATQPVQINKNSQSSQYAGVVDTSAQAIDGRYASVYQTVHCNMVPTSPAVDISEFPPQKAALSKGHGNFQVGGLGSGETTFYPARVKETFRGGLSWPERGSVFSARPSAEPDAFANSLRKYPSLSPERSAEMVERLINYSQFKNSKAQRLQALRAEFPNRPRKTPEADVRTDESPTRERSRRYYEDSTTTDRHERSSRYYYDDDRSKKYEEGDRRFDRNLDRNEIKNVRDVAKRGREMPYTYPMCQTIKERYDHSIEEKRDPYSVQISIDTQVEVPAMYSKEVATVPKINPSKRNVAISISPLPSIFGFTADKTSKSIQTLKTQEITLLPVKSVQSCFSSIDISNNKAINSRKSKSQEEFRENYLEDDVFRIVKDLGPDERRSLRDDLLKTLKRVYKDNKGDKVKIKFGNCVRDQLFSDIYLKDFTRELSNQLISKIKKNNALNCTTTNIYRAKVQSYRNYNDENCVDDVIEDWLRDIPIKNRDSGKSIIKDHLLLTITKKIKRVVVNKLKLNSDESLLTEIIQLIEDIPLTVSEYDKKRYLNRLATDLIRRIKETMTMCSHRVEKSNTDDKDNMNNTNESNNNTAKVEEVKYCVREELADFVDKFHLKICSESRDELEVELTDIVLNTLDAIRFGKEDKIKEAILHTLYDMLTITEYQANYFANNMILSIKKMLSDVPKVKSQTLIVIDKQRVNNAEGLIDRVNENDIKANLVWYTNQVIEQINKWISCIRGLNPNDDFTKVVIHDLAGDIVDRHKYLELNPTTKVSEKDEIEHLKYQIFKWVNKLVGDDNLETIEKASELMGRIQNVPVPKLIKSHNTTKGYCQMNNNRPCSNSRRTSITVDYGTGIARSNITVAIGSVPQNKVISSDSEESRIEDTLSSQAHNKGKASVCLPVQSDNSRLTNRMSDLTGNKEQGRNTPQCRDMKQCNTPAEQKTKDQIIEEFDQFLKNWIEKIPISEKTELTEKCRLGIYNGIWKAIAKIKLNPEASDNPLFYKDVLDDEIEELLDCLIQTPELKRQRNGLKAEVLQKAADINERVTPAALNVSYKQQLVENISNNLPKTANRVDHAEQDLNKLYEEIMKLHLADYFILYTKYKEDDPIKANVFKRKLLQEVHELVEGVKQTHGKQLRDIEIKQYVEGVIHGLQRVPVPNDETVNQETDEIILALEVEQWFSDLPLMPNEECMDILSRRKYRDMLAKKLFDLQNSNGVENKEQMKEEITKFLKRMPFIPGEAENMEFMVEELIVRIKNRPKEVNANTKKAIAFVEPHGYEAFSRDMPLCSSYSEDQNGSSYMVVGGERAPDTSMVYGGQHVHDRNDKNSQEWQSSEQTATPRSLRCSLQSAGPCCRQSIGERAPDGSMTYSGQNVQGRNDPDSQQEWLSLEQTVSPEAMKSLQDIGSCCGQLIGGERPSDRSTTYGGQNVQGRNDPDSQQEWLSLEQTITPEAIRGSLQDAIPCCRRPSRPQSISSPRRSTLSAPQQGANVCCGQPTCAQSTLSPRRNSSPPPLQGADPCCGKPTCAQSTLSPRRNSSPPLIQGAVPPSRRGSQLSSGALVTRQRLQSLEQSKAPSTSRRTSFASQENTDPCCKHASCLSQISTASQTKTANLSRRLSPSPNATTGQTISRSQSPARGLSDDKLVPATSKTKLKSKPTRESSASSLSDNNLELVKSKTTPTKSKPPKGRSSASSLTDEKSVKSKTKPKKPKRSLKVDCECFKTPNNSSRQSVGTVSRGQSPVRGLSDDKLRQKAKSIKSKPPSGRLSATINKPTRRSSGSSLSDNKLESITSKTKPKKSKPTRGHSATSLSDESSPKTKPKKLKPPQKVESGCCTSPDSTKEIPNTTRRHSKLSEGIRPSTSRPNYDFPGECLNRPAGYSRPGPPDKGRSKRRSKDTEEERREADRRRMTMDDSDESDRDDVQCKCMERVWRWKRRGQCRPCDDNPDMEYMYPFPMMYPPPPYFY